MVAMLPIELLKDYMVQNSVHGQITVDREYFSSTYIKASSSFTCEELNLAQKYALDDLMKCINTRFHEIGVTDTVFACPFSHSFTFHDGTWIVQYAREIYYAR